MKTAAIALALTILPHAAARAMEVNVGLEVHGPGTSVAVSATHGAPVWEPARREYHGGRWVERPGYWRQPPLPAPAEPVVYREPAPVQVVYAEQPPPPSVVEVRPASPYPHAVWVPGYWRWDNRRHVWMVGRWVTPQPGYAWHAPRWYRDGRRWAWAPGSWRRQDGYHHRRHDGRDGRRDDRHHDRDDRRHHGRSHHHGRGR